MPSIRSPRCTNGSALMLNVQDKATYLLTEHFGAFFLTLVNEEVYLKEMFAETVRKYAKPVSIRESQGRIQTIPS